MADYRKGLLLWRDGLFMGFRKYISVDAALLAKERFEAEGYRVERAWSV